jgi:hypothetical protein
MGMNMIEDAPPALAPTLMRIATDSEKRAISVRPPRASLLDTERVPNADHRVKTRQTIAAAHISPI